MDPSGNVCRCVKDSYDKYRSQGLASQDALNNANKDLFYKRNLSNGLNPTDALNRAEVDLELHRSSQKYQMLTNHADITIGGNSARRHGTLVHNSVSNLMRDWSVKQEFMHIKIETEKYFPNINTGEIKGSSRIDMIITETTNSNKHYIFDIKTGKATYSDLEFPFFF